MKFIWRWSVRAYAMLMLCVFISGMAKAESKATYPIGEIAVLEGTAHYVRGDQKVEIKQGNPVFFQSSLETDPASKVLILFIDDTEITLGEDSALTIDEFIFDPYDSKENTGQFNFTKGVFLWTSGLISKRDEPDVTLNTPHGSIGIRGTQLWGGDTAKGYGVLVNEGLVDFSGGWGNVSIPAGKGVFLNEDNKAPQGPAASWPRQTTEKAYSEVTFSGIGADDLNKKLGQMKQANIQKRHDYRGRMFPYKENPFKAEPKEEKKDFFTEEFEKLRNK
jgi:hypothetical protein